MKKRLLHLLIILSFCAIGIAQDSLWSLDSCIRRAMEQNLQLQNKKLTKEELKINTKLAKGQWQPNLSFSTSHGVSHSPWREKEIYEESKNSSYNGNYSLGGSWTVFNGFKRKNNIEQNELQEEIQSQELKRTEEELTITVLTYYIELLYAIENVKIHQNSLSIAEEELNRQKTFLEVGSISKIDFSQIEAQYASEHYQLVEAENELRNKQLQLKQLLRLDLNEEISIYQPSLTDEVVMQPLPLKEEVISRGLENRPEIEGSLLNQKLAEIKIKSAKSSYYPTINLNAGISSGHNTSSTLALGEQMKQNFGENIGLSLGYSIFDNRSRKSAVEIARLGEQKASLETEQTIDEIKIFLENIYMNAVAAQLSYQASLSKEKAIKESYELTREKYQLGMKSPFEMLSEKNSLLTTQGQTIQAKYTALLNLLILHVYQGIPINL